MDNVRLFKFTRGEDYSATILVRDGVVEGVVDESYPVGCPVDVAQAFITEAELVVNNRLVKEDD